jgi:hypothetical protein
LSPFNQCSTCLPSTTIAPLFHSIRFMKLLLLLAGGNTAVSAPVRYNGPPFSPSGWCTSSII